MNDKKLFIIQPDDHYYIFTGRAQDGTRMLVTSGIDDVMVVVYFAPDGSVARVEEKPGVDINYEATNSREINDAREKEAINTVMRDLGMMTIEPIQVKKFFLTKHFIGIRQYPDTLQRFLSEIEYSREEIDAIAERKRELKEKYPKLIYLCFSEALLSGYSEQEDRDDKQWFEDWTESGDYVMWRQNDYWSDEAGFIHSS